MPTPVRKLESSIALLLLPQGSIIILLRASFSAPRVQHLLQCSPSLVPHHTFDNLLRSALRGIINLDTLNIQWHQASLPIKDGGLGSDALPLCNRCLLVSDKGTVLLQHLPRQSCPPDSVWTHPGSHGCHRLINHLPPSYRCLIQTVLLGQTGCYRATNDRKRPDGQTLYLGSQGVEPHGT